ncbi:MAG: GTPase-associated system all-helical protein GASH [Sphingomonas adhaesiva]|uniref:GTPase-associated system all-helical protein GASH n=1 Tax=Sphingomonas adhaesiva TaxID=28212 RepID=UPI002FFB3760
MTDNISVHMRITGMVPTNEDVDSRRAAASALSSAWLKFKDSSQIVSKSAEIAEALGGDGTPGEQLGTEVQKAVQKKASAFLYNERPLEVGVVAGMAAVTMLSSHPNTNGWTTVDVYSNALWLALAFQPVLQDEKRENLRQEVLDLARRRSVASAERARERDTVPGMGALTVEIESGTVTNNFQDAALGTINALRRNAALDREELDFMWWSLLARSRLVGRPLGGMSEPLRLVASGIEATVLLRRFPAEVHRDLVLRTVDADPELDLAGLLAEIGDDRERLVSGFVVNNVDAHPTVFPLLHAISTGGANGAGSDVKRPASIWGARALLEGALTRMMSTGALNQ